MSVSCVCLEVERVSVSCERLNMETLRPHKDNKMAVLNARLLPSDRLDDVVASLCGPLSRPSPLREKLRANMVVVLLILPHLGMVIAS